MTEPEVVLPSTDSIAMGIEITKAAVSSGGQFALLNPASVVALIRAVATEHHALSTGMKVQP